MFPLYPSLLYSEPTHVRLPKTTSKSSVVNVPSTSPLTSPLPGTVPCKDFVYTVFTPTSLSSVSPTTVPWTKDPTRPRPVSSSLLRTIPVSTLVPDSPSVGPTLRTETVTRTHWYPFSGFTRDGTKELNILLLAVLLIYSVINVLRILWQPMHRLGTCPRQFILFYYIKFFFRVSRVGKILPCPLYPSVRLRIYGTRLFRLAPSTTK